MGDWAHSLAGLPLRLLIWIDLSTVLSICLSVVLVFSRPVVSVQGTEGDIATVDHSDMRGLVTDLTSLRRGAALLYGRGSAIPNRRRHIGGPGVLHTGLPYPEPKPQAHAHAKALLACGLPMTSRAMAQMKPASSRATAVVT